MDADWNSQGSRYIVRNRLGQITVNLDRPSAGFSIELQTGEDNWQPLGSVFSLTEWPQSIQLVDTWVRRHQLWASYSETSDYPLKTHLAWKLWPPELCSKGASIRWLVVETVLSIQTDLLDARPHSRIACCFDKELARSAEPVHASPFEGLHQPEPFADEFCNPFAYLIECPAGWAAVSIHPSDLETGLSMSRDEKHAIVDARMKFQHMEKGVIRRARMLFALVPSEDRQPLRELVQRFRYSPVPLSV
ncbi:MAG TPA: hypothetical protein PKD54_14610 [Pirellulaceae bacterium]|nr:hypothetical protein [Pirellulaceae bacterium]